LSAPNPDFTILGRKSSPEVGSNQEIPKEVNVNRGEDGGKRKSCGRSLMLAISLTPQGKKEMGAVFLLARKTKTRDQELPLRGNFR